MGFLLITFIVVFVINAVVSANKSTTLRGGFVPNCPPHKWIYDEQELLHCSLCKRRPNYEGRE